MRLGMGLGLGNLLSGGPITGLPNNYSFNFDGDNDYLDVPISGTLTAFTFSGWFNADVLENTNMWEWGTGSSERLGIYTWDNDFHVKLKDQNLTTSAHGLSTGTWFHLANTYDGSTLTLYLNGSSFATASHSSVSTTPVGNLRIGGDTSAGGGYKWDGKVDEFAFWNVALSADDVAKIASKPSDLSKASSYDTDRTSNLKLWLRAGDKILPEEDASIARSDFYTDFDGTDDVVNCGSDSSLDNIWNGGATITAWIRPESIGETEGRIIDKRTSGTGWTLHFREDIGGTACKLKMFQNYDGDDGQYPTNDAVITYNEWQHIAISYDTSGSGSSYRPNIYVNGILVAFATVTDSTGTVDSDEANDLIIGNTGDGTRSYDGAISNLALHQTILDAQTIKQFAKSRFTPMRENNRFSVVDFDGTNDSIVTSGNIGISGSSARTLGLWFKPDATDQYYELIEWGGTGSANATCGLFLYNSKIYFYGWGAGDFDTGVAPLSTWQHLYATYDGTTVKVYLNGALIGSSSESLNTSDTVLKIGDSQGNEFAGSISSVSIYDVAKTEQEIYALYQKGITYDESSLSGLVGYWRMGSGTGDTYPTIKDQSTNSNDGTITNGAVDDIVQQMVAGYDMGAFESTGEEVGDNTVPTINQAPTSDHQFESRNATYSSIEVSDNELTLTLLQGDNVGMNIGNLEKFGLSASFGYAVGDIIKVSWDAKYVSVGSSSGESLLFLNSGASVIFPNTPLTLTSEYQTFANYYTVTTLAYRIPQWYRNGTPASAGTDVWKFKNFSVQKLLQSADLSDTYPAIIDVNEPVLGAELFTNGWTNDGDGGSYDDWGGSFSYDSSANTVSATSDGTNNTFRTNFTSVANAFYKITFTVDSKSGNVELRGLSPGGNLESPSSSPSLINVGYPGVGNIIRYVKSTVSATVYVGFRSGGASRSIAVSDFSIKQLSGNPGLMTNQAAEDLVYSSVLPDQSFLTGVNSAYNFIDLDGSDEYIDCGDGTSLDITSAITLSAWVNSDVIDIHSFIAGRDDGTNRNYYLELFTDEQFYWTCNGLSDAQVTSDTTLSAGSWYHVVGTYDGSNIKLYINGVEAGSDSSTGSIDNDDVSFTIGAREAGADRFINGKMGQVSLWNKALSATEISAIYTLGRHGNLLDSYSDNLVGYWAMSALDASTGLSDVGNGTIYDRSGQSNHGTATNTEAADLASSPNAEPNGYAKGDTNRSTTIP